ncbi:quinolinate synthase NadA [Campylobacter fetus]|uniref:quinolinate synthase NadA n=1 Tax=Campylobacter fetus TaxID=196 RepID=UPI0005090C2D|nr:quinolinate synthase NadA [Campylobacter fetus]WKW18036.1 quinolinate synthase NadA [Campylobacter fetus subsp. fetus]AIR78678.1 quinolinate synthase [Campylobacter fetus subsp. fetus 04/554]EAJ5693108.1 quinolinate synthase NadA [Campylobacter fetus]EAJ5705290.1 quinolinate synthase NadA [Campylobacter fetus]EAJ9256262.1 quinolinate synthase NadA [Campylobacter fetus]
MQGLKTQIKKYLKDKNALLVAHYYQKDEIVEIADITGDSLELAKKASKSDKNLIIFCGVAFMGQSVKILSPHKKVIMPKLACCSLAKMIDEEYFKQSIEKITQCGIAKEDIFPIVYINSSAAVKAEVGKMGGVVCTSSNADKIFDYAIQSNKKIFFLPDRCLGINLAKKKGLSFCILNKADKKSILESQILCYDGFCSIHQAFTTQDIENYRKKYKDILIITHPECDPSVVEKSDFVGSTSQIIDFVKKLSPAQTIAIGTEFNLVNRLRKGSNNTFVLSSTPPICPTMNETTLHDLLRVLEAMEGRSELFTMMNEVIVPQENIHYAKLALDKMLDFA